MQLAKLEKTFPSGRTSESFGLKGRTYDLSELWNKSKLNIDSMIKIKKKEKHGNTEVEPTEFVHLS